MSEKVNATHIMGGEITWECLNNGQYVFTLKIYRDCNGISFTTNGHRLETHNYPNNGALGNIPMNFFSVTDITPSCEGSPCSTLSPSDPDIPGAIEEYILKSNPVTLNGIPGANGWVFTWTYGDRNAAIDNITNASNYGITLRAKMFNYNGQNANACFDSSPDFYQKPSTIICAGEKFVYNHSAFDNELDSLSYSWARPLDGQYCDPPPCYIGGLFQEGSTPNYVPFDATNNFSFNSPYPGTSLDARNVPAVLDPNSGEITFTSFNTGEFVSIIKVEAFKCGIKVAEIYRELQTVITSGCASNEPPEISPPFANGTFNDTVKAGDIFSFDINVFDTLRTDNPKDDSIFFYASGLQFGTNYTSTTNGCLNPPCATLTTALPDTGLGTYSTHFNWQTSCNHLSNNTPTCVNSQNTYVFVIRAFDDFCPAAGQTIASIALTILAKERVPHPDIHCADVQADGSVIIDWNQTSDPDLSFVQWKIYRSTNRNGPYTLIDSILNFNTTTYTDVNAGANNQSAHYIVRAESGCNSDWLFTDTDTISSMYIDPSFNNNCVTVSWNTLDSPLPTGSGALYDVYREYPIGSGFVLYQTIAANSFCDTFRICTDTVTYRIFLSNTGNGCIGSSSNINGIRFQNPLLSSTTTTQSNVSCNGLSDAVAFVSPTGGTTPYTFLWSDNQTTDTARNLAAATYNVTVTDNNGCTTTNSVSITQPTTLSAAIANAFDVSCNGLADGSAVAAPSGGTAPYTFLWNNSQTTDTAKNLIAGNYSVTITDNQGCTATAAAVVNQPDALTISLTRSPISCFSFNDGIIRSSISGGTQPYIYNWSANQSTDSIKNLSAGTYTLTITDLNNCSSSDSATITEPSEISLSVSPDDTVCINVPKTIIASAAGGTGTPIYTWNNNLGNSSSVFVTPQSKTTYIIRVTDQNNCPVKTDSVVLDVRNIFDDLLDLTSTGNICRRDSSELAYTHQGDFPPYTFTYNNGLTNQNPQKVSPANTTEYVLRVTDVCNNSITDTVLVEVSDLPSINLPDTLLTGCEPFTVNLSNNTSPNLNYLWSFGNGATSTIPTPSFTYTQEGNYQINLTVSTQQGCKNQYTGTYFIRVYPSPFVNIIASPTITDIENSTIRFSDNFSDATAWRWNFGNGDSSLLEAPFYTYTDTGTYLASLWKINQFGCVDSGIQRIVIEPNYTIKIPNAFVPNTGGSSGGGYDPNGISNAVFHPFLEYTKDYHLMIFNRWGELIFESKDVNIGWDGYYRGKLSQSDVYVYKLNVTFVNGQRVTKVGDVTLLR